MRGIVLGLLGLLLAVVPTASAGTRIMLVARDLEERPLPGLRFAHQGNESLPTNRTGATALNLKGKHPPGEQIKVTLVSGPKQADEWFLVDPLVNIPGPNAQAEVVLMRRSGFRQIAAEARDASRQAASGPAELTAEIRKRVLVEAAARHRLTAEQLETALSSFAETQDPKDKGIAAYLEGEFSLAEDLLNKVTERKESELVETLYYLGASRYEQAKYPAAADSFQKALALRGEDPILLSWLGLTALKLAKWDEAEFLLRRVVSTEQSFGLDDVNLASALNNLATVLQATDRFAEAEPLMRRALSITEKKLGRDHPGLAADLNNLAHLLQATNRSAEAEPLMRRALAIAEKHFGPNHSYVAITLNNLAEFLREANRLVEAEPLMQRALTIAEKSFNDHPDSAIIFNNVGLMYLTADRFAEAEPLLRRALSIDEKSWGPNHPNVASHLSTLAHLLKATNRLTEAEPLIHRALAIDEASFGPDHPQVALDLNNLANLLQESNRLTEAEPLLRRSLRILERWPDKNYQYLAAVLNNLGELLQDADRHSEAEPLMRRALEIAEKIFEPDQPEMITALNNLGRLLIATNHHLEAESLIRRALTVSEEKLGPDHQSVAITLNNLAELLKTKGQLKEAEPLLRRVLVIFLGFSRRTGYEHPHLLAALANYWRLLERLDKSDAEIVKIVEDLLSNYGMELETLLRSHRNGGAKWEEVPGERRKESDARCGQRRNSDVIRPPRRCLGTRDT